MVRHRELSNTKDRLTCPYDKEDPSMKKTMLAAIVTMML